MLFITVTKKERYHIIGLLVGHLKKTQRDTGYLTQYIHSPVKFNEVPTLSFTLDGKSNR